MAKFFKNLINFKNATFQSRIISIFRACIGKLWLLSRDIHVDLIGKNFFYNNFYYLRKWMRTEFVVKLRANLPAIAYGLRDRDSQNTSELIRCLKRYLKEK